MKRMKKKPLFLMLALAVTVAASVNAQVLIGGTGSESPHAAAILDLASGRQSNLGLLLPNVALTDDAGELVLVTAGEGIDMAAVKQTATGMIVYNTGDVLEGPGIYLWNGTSWTSLSSVPEEPLASTFLDTRDGNVYSTGNFGAAGTWMTQNLRYNTGLYLYGSSGAGETTSYAYPNYDEDVFTAHPEYGLWYPWETVTGRTGVSGVDEINVTEHNPPCQGICPVGWHVPTMKECFALIKEIHTDAGNYSTAGTADEWDEAYEEVDPEFEVMQGNIIPLVGAKIKSRQANYGVASNGWSKPATDGGFDALLVIRDEQHNGANAIFWTSTVASNIYDGTVAASYIFGMGNNDPSAGTDGLGWMGYPRILMGSVRCKQDPQN
ncbi:MAG: hypothetical protein LBH61_00310 [Dysgonamonadaceae bacterium]|jgi:uncharacterized protein (TIGR02145 family)|nr:hypothetical protein [Dysgonamonadaceae bacterium]